MKAKIYNFNKEIPMSNDLFKDVRRVASIQLLGKIIVCITVLIILTLGNPDLLDAIIHRVGGWP